MTDDRLSGYSGCRNVSQSPTTVQFSFRTTLTRTITPDWLINPGHKVRVSYRRFFLRSGSACKYPLGLTHTRSHVAGRWMTDFLVASPFLRKNYVIGTKFCFPLPPPKKEKIVFHEIEFIWIRETSCADKMAQIFNVACVALSNCPSYKIEYNWANERCLAYCIPANSHALCMSLTTHKSGRVVLRHTINN